MGSRTPEQLAEKKRLKFLRATGRPSFIEGPEHLEVLRKIRSYHARGMAYSQMERQTGVSHRTISGMIERPRVGVLRVTWAPLMRMTFEEPAPHIRVASTGTRRRLQAMWADGFPLPFLTERLSFGTRGYLQQVIRGTKGFTVTAGSARSVAELYEELEGKTPADFGIDDRRANFCRAFAAKKGCVPRSCWDAYTIDDPEAQPEWTGQCGTPFGQRIHRQLGIPVCQPCKDAGVAQARPNGKRLRALRERAGYSRPVLAKMVGVDMSTILYWEDERTIPLRQGKFDRLLDILDVTYDEICEEL